jgi:glycerol uptake facilitator-like aquaporin
VNFPAKPTFSPRWGIGVLLGVVVSGGVSGGHLNPAVSVAVASLGKFPWWKVRRDY